MVARVDFSVWIKASGKTEGEHVEALQKLDPSQKGISGPTLRRIRGGHVCGGRQLFLLMKYTGLPIEAFFSNGFLQQVEARLRRL